MGASTEHRTFADRAAAAVLRTRHGEVTTYGEIAAEAGSPRAARAVGTVLRHRDGLPWWRVVAADGRLAPGLEVEQARLLAAEGVDTESGPKGTARVRAVRERR